MGLISRREKDRFSTVVKLREKGVNLSSLCRGLWGGRSIRASRKKMLRIKGRVGDGLGRQKRGRVRRSIFGFLRAWRRELKKDCVSGSAGWTDSTGFKDK